MNKLTALTFGVMAHVVSANLPAKNLEGPVFGSKLGTYPLQSLDNVQYCREYARACRPDAPFQVTLYQSHFGALENSSAEDQTAPFNSVGTVPSPVKRMLLQAAEAPDAWNPATASTVLPAASLEPIPEEQAAWNSPRNVSEEDHVLPGEIPVPEGDMDASPLSDDEMDPADPNFHPTAQQLVDLKIAHDNSGHPTANDFARMIKLGNGSIISSVTTVKPTSDPRADGLRLSQRHTASTMWSVSTCWK